MNPTRLEEELLISEHEESVSQSGRSHQIVIRGLFNNKYLVAASTVALLSGILFGYDIGVISGAIIQLRTLFNLSCFQQEITIASVVIGAFLSSLFAGFLIDYFGRKVIIVLSGLVYVFGAIVASVAPNYGVLVFARLCLGTAISLSNAAECVYVSEISPMRFRGTLVSFNELGITVGFLLAYCSNAIFASDSINGWRWMFGLAVIFAVIMMIIICWLPYSPRQLLVKGRVDEAKATLCKLRQCDPSSDSFIEEWTSMRSHISVSNTVQSSVCDLFCNSCSCYSIFLAFSLMIIQQLTGQPNLLFYASTVLISFGFPAGAMTSICTVGIGFAKLLSALVCMSIVDRFERKTFLMLGSFVMFLSLLVISICAIVFDVGIFKSCTNGNATLIPANMVDIDAGSIKWIVLLSLLVFVAAYGFSFGPMSWIFLSEIFPTNIRGKAFSLTVSLNWLMYLILSLTFLDFANACGGVGVPYLINAIIAFSAIFFLNKFVPKTRGKSLEEIQDLMKVKSSMLFGTK